MATWKWGLVAIPAVSGIVIGAQKFVSQASEELPPPDFYEFKEKVPEILEEDDLETELDSQESLETTLQSQNHYTAIQNSQIQEPKFEKVRSEANSAFKKLDDYTFKLFSPCGVGTGWILDYQLPEKTGSYPLIWYIATNAHVVERWFFDQSNIYGQKLPRDRRWLRGKPFGIKSDISLFTQESCRLKGQGFFDINLAKWNDGKLLNSDKGAISQKKMKAPRLFWSAVNLFNVDHSMDIKNNKNYKDFAVIEIEFTDEKSAREITRNFADTYKVGFTDVINVFGDSLDLAGTATNEDNFYTLGYPYYKKDSFKHSRNLNEKTLVADRLTRNNKAVFFNIGGAKNINPKGYVGTQPFAHIGFSWGGIKYQRTGHFYLMNGKVSGKGSSGSMYIDGQGNLLGVKSLVEKVGNTQNSMITPLRSKKIILEGNFKTPEYDLILGGYKHQKSSYKSQVEKYLTKKGKKTWLSQRQGWNNGTQATIIRRI